MAQKYKPTRFANLRCKECGSNMFIVDREENEVVCADCGLIKAVNQKYLKEKVIFT